jgi:hypothetical protein
VKDQLARRSNVGGRTELEIGVAERADGAERLELRAAEIAERVMGFVTPV